MVGREAGKAVEKSLQWSAPPQPAPGIRLTGALAPWQQVVREQLRAKLGADPLDIEAVMEISFPRP